MARFSHEIIAQYTPCNNTPRHEICHALAIVHAELLLIHPFREGNGRLARLLADLMVAQARLPLPAYRFVGRGSVAYRARYLHAVQEAYLMRYAELEDFFEGALRFGAELAG
jgi:cell filamentation protein